MNIINNIIIKIKNMKKNKNVSIETEPIENLKTVEAEATNSEADQSISTTELTQDTLDKAIAKFNSTNPVTTWEEISQEERWNYIKEAHNN